MDNMKPMEDAIVFLEEGPSGIFVDFQPGNGTRYLIGLTKFSDGANDYPQTRKATGGISSGGWLMTWINCGRCCVLQPEGFLWPNYLQEKIGGSLADAIVLSRLVAHLTFRKV